MNLQILLYHRKAEKSRLMLDNCGKMCYINVDIFRTGSRFAPDGTDNADFCCRNPAGLEAKGWIPRFPGEFFMRLSRRGRGLFLYGGILCRTKRAWR